MYEQWTPSMSRRERERLEQRAKARLRQLVWCGGIFLLIFGDVHTPVQRVMEYLPHDMQSAFTHLGTALTKGEYLVEEVGAFFGGMLEGEIPEFVVKPLEFVEKIEEQEEVEEEKMEEKVEINTLEEEERERLEFYQDSLAQFVSPSWSIQQGLWSDVMENVERREELERGEEREVNGEEDWEKEIEDIVMMPIGTILQSIEGDLSETHSDDYIYLGERSMVAPVNNVITSPFGMREHPLTYELTLHNGVDIRGSEGTPIVAWSDGVVEVVGRTSIVGLYLRISHGDEISTFYAHCSEIWVEEGQYVTAGEEIALVGATGEVTAAHLHFELKYQDVYLNPLHYIEHGGLLD